VLQITLQDLGAKFAAYVQTVLETTKEATNG